MRCLEDSTHHNDVYVICETGEIVNTKWNLQTAYSWANAITGTK